MKSKTKSSKPPSKIKYLKNNPSITFNVPIEISQKIDEMCETKGVTKSQFLKNYYIDQVTAFDDIKAKHTAESENIKKDAYEDGHKKGSIDKEKILKEEYEKNIETAIKTRLESRLVAAENLNYDEGYDDSRKEQEEIIRKKNIITMKCCVCEKPLTIDISKNIDRKLIIDSIKNQIKHVGCIE